MVYYLGHCKTDKETHFGFDSSTNELCILPSESYHSRPMRIKLSYTLVIGHDCWLTEARNLALVRIAQGEINGQTQEIQS